MKSDLNDIDPLVEPHEEKAHRLVRASLAATPGIGGTLVEFMNMFWVPPLDRRRKKWMIDITHDLYELEGRQDGIVKGLFENEEFVSILTTASQQAILTHQAEKLEALRAAIRNSSSGVGYSFDKQTLFLRYISQFTVQHIHIIQEIANLPPEIIKPSRGIQAISPPELSLENKISRSCNHIGSTTERDLQHLLVRELHDSGMLAFSNQSGFPSLTRIGREFTSYICSD